MGNEAQSHTSTFLGGNARAGATPQLMAQPLAFWPEVQAAWKAGHTLRLIHQRLNTAGVPISYELLGLYRGRIERRKKGTAVPASPSMLRSCCEDQVDAVSVPLISPHVTAMTNTFGQQHYATDSK